MIRHNHNIVIPEKPKALSGIHSPVGAQLRCAIRRAESPSRAGLLQVVFAALVALTLAPGAALAYDECDAEAGTGTLSDGEDGVSDPTLNGSDADTFTCDPRDNHSSGITYTSDGHLTVQTIDLDSFRGPTFDVGTDGINVTAGNAADNLFWDSSGFVSTRDGAIQGTAGVVMDYRSVDGDIDILLGGEISGIRNTTHAIRAEATGAGNIDVMVEDSINDNFRASGIGIEALTVGGNITIDTDRVRSTSGEFAIVARSSAGGDILVDSEAVTGNGEGILTDTSGNTTIDMIGIPTSGNAGLEAATTAVRALGGGDVTFGISAAGGRPNENRLGQFAEIVGAMDFSGAGSAQVGLGEGSVWQLADHANSFSPGDDRLDIASDALLLGGVFRLSGTEDSTLPFGAGQDMLNNAGTVVVMFSQEGRADDSGGSLLIEGLERFDNSGTILLGMPGNTGGSRPFDPTTSEGGTDDLLSIEGAAYNGLPGSRIFMDVNYNAGGGRQPNCDDSLRNAENDLPGADCVNIKGGSTEGQTSLVLGDRLSGDRGAFIPIQDGIVLIDVSGSDDPSVSGDDHFVLDPASDSYSSDFGGVIDKGLFVYTVGYDETTQQHKLFGAPGSVALQLPLLAHAAQDLWRRSTTSWFERQLDVRNALREGGDPDGGAWARLVRDNAERDVVQDATADGSIFYDNSYEQDNTAFNAGLDFFAGRSGDRAWLAGGMIGYVRADVEFDNSSNEALLEGGSVGVYGSYIDGGFFVDAQLVGNWLSTMRYDAPVLDLFPDTAKPNATVQTYGAEMEAGWRWRAGSLSVEPLAGLSYVQVSLDDIEIPSDDPARPGGNAVYDDPVSFRGSLGARVSAEDVMPGLVPATVIDLGLTTRVVEEFDGDSDIVLENVGPDASIENTFDGTFAEVTGGVTVRNTSGSVAGYLNVEGTFESDYESMGVAAGFRYRW